MRIKIVDYRPLRKSVSCAVYIGQLRYCDNDYHIPLDWILRYNSAWRCKST